MAALRISCYRRQLLALATGCDRDRNLRPPRQSDRRLRRSSGPAPLSILAGACIYWLAGKPDRTRKWGKSRLATIEAQPYSRTLRRFTGHVDPSKDRNEFNERFGLFATVEAYSCRRACIGSTVEARRAGIQLAASPTNTNSSAAPANTTRSFASSL
jgi:hypothetical protein